MWDLSGGKVVSSGSSTVISRSASAIRDCRFMAVVWVIGGRLVHFWWTCGALVEVSEFSWRLGVEAVKWCGCVRVG